MYLALGEKSLGVVTRRQIHDKIKKLDSPFIWLHFIFLNILKRNKIYLVHIFKRKLIYRYPETS